LRAYIVAAILGMAAIGAWAVMTDRVGYVVTDGKSMNPVYYEGDLVFVVKADSYHVGQIAAYHGESPGQRVLHRIIGGNGSSGFVMKGDNNESIDPLYPKLEEMIGRPVLHVPHGGVWLKPLMGPSGLGMLSFLVAGGGATAARTRRDIPRGRRKKRVKAMSGKGGSLATVAAVLKAIGRLPPLLRVASAVAVLLTVLALTLGVLGWWKPILVKQAAEKAPAQSVTFSYSAKVPQTAAYDGTTAKSPDPIFRKLANRVDLRTLYDGPAGTLDLTAELTNGTGWHTKLTLVNHRPFAGPSYEETVTLDLPALAARADAAARAIGAPAGGVVAIALNAHVKTGSLPDVNAPLLLTVDGQRMALGPGAKLTTATQAPSASDVMVPRKIRIFGHTLMTAARARSDALLALIGAGAIAVVIFLLARRGMSLRTRVEIERRHSQLLVHVEPMASPPGKPVVNVDNFPALVKLAERYGQMILTWRRPDADDFVVRDEGITYRYRVPLDEPTLVNVEHINRPSSAGSHRKKAASDVS
jgi:signal peptidase I